MSLHKTSNQDVAEITTPKKLTQVVSWIATLTSLFIAALTYWLLDINAHVALIFVVFSVVNTLIFMFYRTTEDLKLAYWFMSGAIFISVLIICLFSGGITSSFAFFLPIVVISGYAMNINYGNTWLMISVVSFLGLYMVDATFIREVQAVPDKSKEAFSLISMVLATVMLCVIYGRYLSKAIYKSLKKTIEIGDKNRENEALLNEVQHRVQDNLTMIKDMLALQSRFADNEQCKENLKFAKYRVNAMSIVHEMLYSSENVSQINFKTYIEKLSEYLMDSLRIKDSGIDVHVKSEDIFFNMDTAIPLGLLTNEILTHAFLYSLKNKKGTVTIELESLHDRNFILEIGDDSKGVSEDLQFDTVGQEMIDRLAYQLNGHIEKVDPNKPGANFMVIFQEIQPSL